MDLENLPFIIRWHRKKAGLSRDALAKLCNIGKTVIYDIEHGKKTIRMDSLMKVLHVLNLSLQLEGPLMDKCREELLNETR